MSKRSVLSDDTPDRIRKRSPVESHRSMPCWQDANEEEQFDEPLLTVWGGAGYLARVWNVGSSEEEEGVILTTPGRLLEPLKDEDSCPPEEVSVTSGARRDSCFTLSLSEGGGRRRLYNTGESVLILCKGFIGAGILFTPYAVYSGGFLYSLGMLAVTFFLNLYGISVLLSCADACGARSFGDVGGAACGHLGRKAVNVSVILSQMGFCIVLIVFCGNNFRDVSNIWLARCDPESIWTLTTEGCVILCFPIIFALTVGCKRITKLAPFVAIADATIVIVLVTIAVYASYYLFVHLFPPGLPLRLFFHHTTVTTIAPTSTALTNSTVPTVPTVHTDPIVPTVPPITTPEWFDQIVAALKRILTETFKFWVFNSKGWLLSTGILTYIFEGISLILPVRLNVNRHVKSRYPQLASQCLYGVGFIVTTFAVICFLSFGDKISPMVLQNLPSASWAYSLQIAYCFALLLGYPLLLYPVVRTIEHHVLARPPQPHETRHIDVGVPDLPPYMRRRIRTVIQTALILTTFLVAFFAADKLDHLIAIIGAFCCVPLAIIYPGLFHMNLRAKLGASKFHNLEWIKSKIDLRIMDLAMISLGTVMLVSCTCYCVSQWSKDHHVKTKCELLRSFSVP